MVDAFQVLTLAAEIVAHEIRLTASVVLELLANRLWSRVNRRMPIRTGAAADGQAVLGARVAVGEP